ncbi:MAG TPA: decaprenyl-phosphate phosphoribosyltransferase [Ktedonobacteraceae bacterium]
MIIEEKPNISKAQTDNTQPSATGIGNHLQALFVAMRPRQWTKNFALLIGLVFAQHLFYGTSCIRAALALVIFCFSSSFIYLFNDLLDLEKDRQHPLKRFRPMASGRLPVSWAITGGGVLLLCNSVLILAMFSIPVSHDIYATHGGANVLFALTVVAYLVLMVLYSMYLKHVVLIDVFVIAVGFMLRILAGAVVISVIISPWLYLVTCFLSLFLALSKRRHELTLLQKQAGEHRQILKEYSIPLLDQMITIVVTCTLVAYSLYTFEGPTGNQRLIITIPFVLYGMFRYLYLVYVRMEGGSPEEVLLRDRPMLGTVMVCAILIIAVLYLLPP